MCRYSRVPSLASSRRRRSNANRAPPPVPTSPRGPLSNCAAASTGHPLALLTLVWVLLLWGHTPCRPGMRRTGQRSEGLQRARLFGQGLTTVVTAAASSKMTHRLRPLDQGLWGRAWRRTGSVRAPRAMTRGGMLVPQLWATPGGMRGPTAGCLADSRAWQAQMPTVSAPVPQQSGNCCRGDLQFSSAPPDPVETN